MIELGVVAIVPFWSQSDNMNVDSNYAYLRSILPRFETMTKNTIFLMFFPDPKYGRGKWSFNPDGLLSERIRLITWPYDTQMRSSVLGFDPVRYAEVEKTHGPSIYFLNQVEMGSAMMGGYNQSFNASARPVLIAQHHYIIHKSLPYPIKGLFPRRWMQMGGSLAADKVVYNSEHTRRMAEESFAEFIQPKKMQELNDKSVVHRFGLINEDFPRAPAATDHEPIFLYNHRFETYKKHRTTALVLNELKESYDFSVWATQIAGQHAGGKKPFPVDVNAFENSRQAYLERCAVPAINTINSVHETFCISMLDSIALGHLPVAPNSVTFPELVPEDYPFLFKNVSEQTEMLRHILDTWPLEYNKWRERLQEHARKEFDLDDYAREYLKIFEEELARARNTESKATTEKLLNDVFNSLKPGKAYDAQEIKLMVSRGGLGEQAMNLRRVIREALWSGEFDLFWRKGVKLRRK